MAITESTVFDKVRLSADYPENGRVIRYISLYNGAEFVAGLNPIASVYQEGWDPTTTEFGIVKDAVAGGSATYQYVSPQGTQYEAADLPGNLAWMAEANPIKREIDLVQSIDADEALPSALIVYKASVSEPTEEPPCWSATNNTWDIWRAAIEAAGFSVITPPTPTGEEKLWETKATYARTGGTYECAYDGWDTDATLYSRDNGATFTTQRPANNLSGTSSITHIRRYNASLGEWEDEPFSPQFQGAAGVGTSLRQRSFGELTRGNKYIQASAYLPRYYTTRGLQSGRTTHVGVELLYREEWNGEILLRGYTEIPDDLIPLVAPHEIEDDNAVVPVPRKTFLFAMDQKGQMGWGLIDSEARVTDYFGDYHRFTAVFRSNAVGTLRAALSATDTVLRLAVKPRGIAEGTTLYFVADDGHTESMRVTLTPSFSPFVATAEEGGYEYWPVNVGRGGRDGARAWPSGAEWHADQSAGQRHAQFVVFDKRNIHAASEIGIYQSLDQ